MASSDGILLTCLPPPSSITVGNGHFSIPVVSRGTSILPTANTTFHLNNILVAPAIVLNTTFYLNNILVAPAIVLNLLFVRQFTRDNHCSIKFDALGFSVKDPWTGRVILRCNSSGDLYTISPASPSTAASCSLAITSTLWHHRLGHPSDSVVASLRNMSIITCNKAARSLCHACQLGKHTRLPFASSVSTTSEPFALVHCDVWTSPVPSTSGYKYYLVMLDDFTHYCWSFRLHQKSEVYGHFVDFIAYVQTQFGCVPKCFQANNGTELVNHAMSTFLSSRGVVLRLSCPYTSPQNGKAERMLRSINNTICTLLIHASMPPSY
jgi:histone deacetylase 1/2